MKVGGLIAKMIEITYLLERCNGDVSVLMLLLVKGNG